MRRNKSDKRCEGNKWDKLAGLCGDGRQIRGGAHRHRTHDSTLGLTRVILIISASHADEIAGGFVMPADVDSIRLSELLGRLHADHRKVSIALEQSVADLACRIVARKWPDAVPEERRKRESEQRGRASRHFHRQREKRVGAWEFALSELRKECPVPFATEALAEYVGRVNAGAPLDKLSDGLRRIAALLAQSDAITPILLDKLRVAYPAFVDRIGLAVKKPATALHGSVEGAGFTAATMTKEQICDLLGLTDGDFRRLITRGAILEQSRQSFAFNLDSLSLLDRTRIEGKLRERKPG